MGKKQRLKLERAQQMLERGLLPPVSKWWAKPTVIGLGIAYILTSLNQMSALLDFDHYRYLFQQYSEGVIRARYFISWTVRWLGLAAGIGLFFRKEFVRKATVLLAFGTLIAAYWKHPYEGFIRHIQYLNEVLPTQNVPFTPKAALNAMHSLGSSGFSESAFAGICVTGAVATEIVVAATVIFLLTRPPVKAFFK